MLNRTDYAAEPRPRLRAVELAQLAHGDTRPQPALTPDKKLDAILATFDRLAELFEGLTPGEAVGIYADCREIAEEAGRSPEMRAYAVAWMAIAESVAQTGTVSRETVIHWFKTGQAITERENHERQ